MTVLAGSVQLLVVTNAVLGVFCAACVLAVGIAVWMDVRERRRWRRMVPDCWPPPGVDPEAAYAAPSTEDRHPTPHSMGGA